MVRSYEVNLGLDSLDGGGIAAQRRGSGRGRQSARACRRAAAPPTQLPKGGGRTHAGALRTLLPPSGEVWGIDPTAVHLTAEVGTVRTGAHGRIENLPRWAADEADGLPSWAYRSVELLHRIPTRPGHDARVYNRGTLSRVFAASTPACSTARPAPSSSTGS